MRASPMRRPAPRSSCWRGARSDACRTISRSKVRRQRRAAHQRARRARDGLDGGGEGEGRRRGLISAAEGNGPVNVLDLALRKDLGKYQIYIDGLELIDYRVRILNGGTEAVTRVMIECRTRPASVGPRSASRQHHRRVVPGADGFGRLQARQGRRAGMTCGCTRRAVIRRGWRRVHSSPPRMRSVTSSRRRPACQRAGRRGRRSGLWRGGGPQRRDRRLGNEPREAERRMEWPCGAGGDVDAQRQLAREELSGIA